MKLFRRVREKIVLIPSVLILSVLPLICVRIGFRNALAGFDFAAQTAGAEDMYLVGKDIFLIIMAVWSLVMVFMKRKKPSALSAPICVFAVLCLLSAIFSRYTYFSIFGINDQFEPVSVLLCYCLMLLCTSLLTGGDGDAVILMKALIINSLAVSAVGIVQLFRGEAVCSTLYNQDYVGTYSAVVFPMIMAMIFYFYGRDRRWFLISAAAAGLLLVTLLASGSAGGILAVLSALALLAYAFFRKGRKWMALVPAVLAAAAAVLLLILWNRSYSAPDRSLTDVSTEGECAVFEMDGLRLSIGFEMPDAQSYAFYVLDGSGIQLDYSENAAGDRYIIDDDRYSAYSFSLTQLDSGIFGFVVYVDGRQWYFGLDNKGSCHVMNGYGRLVELVHAQRAAAFDGHESFLSSRGYIWSRTLPLIKKYWLLGSGPDTFTTVFPQNDLGKLLDSDYQYSIIFTKPHSLYLQAAEQLGVPALLMLLLFSAMLLRGLLKKSSGNLIVSGLFASMSGFLLISIVNDSCACVTPVAAVLAGVALYAQKQ